MAPCHVVLFSLAVWFFTLSSALRQPTRWATPARKLHEACSPARPVTAALRASPSGTDSADGSDTVLTQFLGDAAKLGAVRFVVVGSGAILEAVGSFSNLRYATTPKGRLATVSTDIPCFECHIRLAEVMEIKNVVVEKFGKVLRITRFLGADGATLLSAILHTVEGPGVQGDVDAW